MMDHPKVSLRSTARNLGREYEGTGSAISPCVRSWAGRLVGENAGHWREVSDVPVDHPEKCDDGGLVGRDAVKVTHRFRLICLVPLLGNSAARPELQVGKSGKS